MISGGAGFLASGGRFGLFSGAIAGSMYDGDAGVFLQAGWEGRIGDFGIVASTSRTFGQFEDLASLSSIDASGKIDPTARMPKALDRLSVNYTFDALKAGVGASFIHRQTADGKRSLLLSGSYSQTLFKDVMMSASAFADLGDDKDYGGFLTFSIPLGETMNASSSASYAKNAAIATAEVSRPFNDEGIPVAWRVSHSEGESRITQANGAVRTNVAQLDGMIVKQDDSMRANASVEGSLVMAGGSVLAGRKIYDSFAIVNVGAKGVPVEYENRYAGKTGSSGKLLLPQLNSFHKNKISIDVEGLPLNADVGETEVTVIPRDKAGVVVDFGVKTDSNTALVVLTDAAGKNLPEGTEVLLEGAGEPFIVGYDGQVYLTGIASENTLSAKYKDMECHASFDFKPSGEAQTMIGPVSCS
jgi:outer membrane usher protein